MISYSYRKRTKRWGEYVATCNQCNWGAVANTPEEITALTHDHDEVIWNGIVGIKIKPGDLRTNEAGYGISKYLNSWKNGGCNLSPVFPYARDWISNRISKMAGVRRPKARRRRTPAKFDTQQGHNFNA